MPSTSHCAAGALLRIDNGKEKLIPSNPLRAKGLHEQMRPRKKSGHFSLRDRHFFSCLYVARLLDPWRRGRAGPGRGAWREEARGLPAGSWRRRKPTLCGPKRGGQGELWPEGGFGDRAGASLVFSARSAREFSRRLRFNLPPLHLVWGLFHFVGKNMLQALDRVFNPLYDVGDLCLR